MLKRIEQSVGDDGSRVVANHAVAMTGTGPFGQETTLEIGVGKAFQHLLAHRRIKQVDEREERAECIPEARIGEHISRAYLTIVGTIMDYISLSIVFVEHAREECGTVETGVERTKMFNVFIFYLDAAQHFVPTLVSCLLHFIERAITDFLQVALGLFRRDER